MDVRDYSQRLDQAREKYKNAQEELRSNYNNNTEQMKESFDTRLDKNVENFNNQKTKLEEQNQINNQFYSDKAKSAVAKRQEDFRNEIKKNSEKFDVDRSVLKNQFQDRIAHLGDSYNKSTEQNNRFHDQAKQSMTDRYAKANQNYKNSFDNQIEVLNNRSKESFGNLKQNYHNERKEQDAINQENIEKLSASGQEQKFKEISRLKNDNENLRTLFGEEKKYMKEQQDARVDDILKLKNKETVDSQKNFADLQNNIREKSLVEDERVKVAHHTEAKELERKFNEDLRNVQQLSNKKLKGGVAISTLKDENKQMVKLFDERLQSVRDNISKEREREIKKEQQVDANYRDKIKAIKISNAEEFDQHDVELNALHHKKFQELRDKNESIVDRYKDEVGKTKIAGEEKLVQANQKSKNRLIDQRVEFGKIFNNINNKKLDEISNIKSEISKDKTNFIEKSRRETSDEKAMMRNDFNHKLMLKEEMYEKKLSDMDNQTKKIIENYEDKIDQIIRKTSNEVNGYKISNEERQIKESQAMKIALASQEEKNKMELFEIREKFERIIAKDRNSTDQRINGLVQKYEDQLEKERVIGQKDLSTKVNEYQAQIERIYKNTEMDKANIRNQFEQQIENLRLANISPQGNLKKV